MLVEIASYPGSSPVEKRGGAWPHFSAVEEPGYTRLGRGLRAKAKVETSLGVGQLWLNR